jgi:hypothetical protein
LFPEKGFSVVDTQKVEDFHAEERLRAEAELPEGEKVEFYVVTFVSSGAVDWMADGDIVIKRPGLEEEFMDVMRPNMHIFYSTGNRQCAEYEDELPHRVRANSLKTGKWSFETDSNEYVISDPLGRLVHVRTSRRSATSGLTKVLYHIGAVDQSKAKNPIKHKRTRAAWMVLKVIHRIFMDNRGEPTYGPAYRQSKLAMAKIWDFAADIEHLPGNVKCIKLTRGSLSRGIIKEFWERLLLDYIADQYSVPRGLREMCKGIQYKRETKGQNRATEVIITPDEFEQVLLYSAWPEWSEWRAPVEWEVVEEHAEAI